MGIDTEINEETRGLGDVHVHLDDARNFRGMRRLSSSGPELCVELNAGGDVRPPIYMDQLACKLVFGLGVAVNCADGDSLFLIWGKSGECRRTQRLRKAQVTAS